MSGTGRVLSTGMRARPDDGKQLLAVLTDGRDESTGFDSIYLDPDGPVPPDGVEIIWHGKAAVWQLPSGERVAATKIGMSFDSTAPLR